MIYWPYMLGIAFIFGSAGFLAGMGFAVRIALAERAHRQSKAETMRQQSRKDYAEGRFQTPGEIIADLQEETEEDRLESAAFDAMAQKLRDEDA